VPSRRTRWRKGLGRAPAGDHGWREAGTDLRAAGAGRWAARPFKTWEGKLPIGEVARHSASRWGQTMFENDSNEFKQFQINSNLF
jgi:hypothetical protein